MGWEIYSFLAPAHSQKSQVRSLPISIAPPDLDLLCDEKERCATV